jgi:hypothetical protein
VKQITPVRAPSTRVVRWQGARSAPLRRVARGYIAIGSTTQKKCGRHPSFVRQPIMV